MLGGGSMRKISVVIPMYNSEKTIRQVVEELQHVLFSMSGYRYEILLVNDCGKDNVLAVAKTLSSEDRNVKVIELTKNVGQENAMFAGYRYCTGDYIVSMDDDGQHPVNRIPYLIDFLIENDLDVVFSKYELPKNSPFRKAGSFINSKMAEIMIGKSPDIWTNSFFVMNQMVCNALNKYRNSRPYVYGIIFAVTGRVANVTVEHRARMAGKSNYSLSSLLRIWFNGFFSFSSRPLRLVAIFGVSISLLTALCGITLFLIWLASPAVEVKGWTSTILVLLLFSGLQLVGIGIVGEYIGRMFVTNSNLPNYVVRSTTNIEENKEDPLK
jgi:undecaprenyl-phosphate 4-deoxy-4-formamido-L-arabinose transferase